MLVRMLIFGGIIYKGLIDMYVRELFQYLYICCHGNCANSEKMHNSNLSERSMNFSPGVVQIMVWNIKCGDKPANASEGRRD